MKTKTTNATKSTNAIGKRNFFQKTFVLLAILVSTGFSFNASAQKYRVTFVNNTSCTFTISGIDNSINTIWSFIVPSGTTTGCRDYVTDDIATIDVSRWGCSTASFSLIGGWSETLNNPCSPICGAGVVVCSETTSTSCPPGAPTLTAEILITIN